MSQYNALLDTKALPVFSKVDASLIQSTVKDAIDYSIKTLKESCEKNSQNPTWDNCIAPIEEADDKLSKIWSIVSHLNSVVQTDKLREAHDNCLGMLSEYQSFIGQYKPYFDILVTIKNSDGFSLLTDAQKKAIENSLRDFKLSGIDLPKNEQEQYKQITSRLSELCSGFANNVLDATYSFYHQVEDEGLLAGIPEQVKLIAKQRAMDKKLQGFILTLDMPCYLPVLTYCQNRDIRKIMYEAYNTKASELGFDQGKYDNSENIKEILKLRFKLAKLLGFDNYAQYSLATKMANNCNEVVEFLENLAKKSKNQAQDELNKIRQLAKEDGIDDLKPWDVSFYAERLKKKDFNIDTEQLREYFPVDNVIQGLFECTSRLFSISFRAHMGVDLWHESVKCYDVYDKFDSKIGTFYLDLYAREGKRSGAWMDECMSRRYRQDGALQIPVAYLVCNFTAPIDNKPSLLTHDEVVTLFHEFGHGLNHLLTKIDIADVSGINGVPWDAVELPSQFLENFAWQEEVLEFLSCSIKNKKPLDKQTLANLIKAKNFNSALAMLRQLEFALFDFKIHLEYDENNPKDVLLSLKEIQDQISVSPRYENSRFPHAFSHIFAGGYAAGYYSYKWAEVLAADAFSRFINEGIFNKKCGDDFRDYILSVGGSVDPLDAFVAFRGRKPDIQALLDQSGIK